MTLITLFVSATKLAGILAAVTVAANAFSFSRYRRKNLRRFRSPINESADILASFDIEGEGENGFFFGLATAPAHVEDRLDDAWLQFAAEEPSHASDQQGLQPADAIMGSATGDGGSQQAPMSGTSVNHVVKKKKPLKIAMEAMIRGFEKYIEGEEEVNAPKEELHHKVAAWHNVPLPEERLRFWSDPDTELKLAKGTGISVFRMGIDWARIMPKEPVNGLKETVNYPALERYKWIINRVRSYGMKVMLTLFHHSLPPWAGDYGGWKLEKTVDYFMDFTRLVVDTVSDMIDYWVTFNEPHVFCMLTYCAGAWPGGNPDMLEVATSALPTGVFNQAMHWMAIAHSKAYDYIHEKSSTLSKSKVGVAHHVSFTRPYGLFDVAAVTLANSLTLFPFVDSISDRLDFIGINYYGQEVISGAGLKLVETDEYSESGRGVYPDGLYRMLIQFHERYKHLNVPFIITENGVSDVTDIIRRPYLIEHLLAVYAAMMTGVPVLGYLFWTISDNWEWADGYGPKFGLVAVDRANNLARIPRPSYHLFTKVVNTGKVTRGDRAHAWNDLRVVAKLKKTRPFYRAVDKHGLMYAGGLDEPIQRPYVERDWRFGHYEMEGLQDPLSRLSRFPRHIFYRLHALCAYVRCIFVALCVLINWSSFDVILADQVSVVIPLLKLKGPTKVLFYCHFPDLLLAQHTTLLRSLYRKPIDFVEEITTGMADMILVNSKFTATTFANTFKHLHARGIFPTVLYPAVNMDQFNEPCFNKLNFLSVNRFERKKNIDLALSAFVMLHILDGDHNIPDVTLTIAGGYDERLRENVEYLEELKRFAIENKVADQVNFVTSCSTAERNALLSECLCVLYTPQDEHFGIVPLEAMVAHKPVIACNSGGPVETIKNGVTGFLCNPTPQAFALAMGTFIKDPQLAKTMGEEAWRHVTENFSTKTFGQRLNRFFNDIFGSKED